MKKITILLMIIGFIITMVGCIDSSETTEFQQIDLAIKESLPSAINSNFILPKFEDMTITWTLGDRVFTDIFIYESPFYDQTQKLSAKISKGLRHATYEYDLFVIAIDSGLNQNKLHITLPVAKEQIDREIYTTGEMTFLTQKNGQEVLEFNTMTAEIRGRGNSTWFVYEKKPYRIKFAADVSVLGMPAARNYTLLAEYADKSLMRNHITHKFSTFFDSIEHHIQTRVIEVYINNEYLGVYTLSEHVEVHENKLFIESDYSILDAGFFLELDQRLFDSNIPDGLEWFKLTGRGYEIKRPNPNNEKYTLGHTDYISSYFYEIQQSLIAKANYDSFIDVDNFIDYFIVQELIKNVDVGWSSIFMYKRTNEVVKMGPFWDFDFAIGNADYIDYGPRNFYGFASNKNYWFHLMMQIPELREAFRVRYNEVYESYIPELLNMIYPMANSMNAAALRNFNKWDILNRYVWPNPSEMVNAKTHKAQVDYVYDFIEARSLWLYEAVNSDAFLNGNYN